MAGGSGKSRGSLNQCAFTISKFVNRAKAKWLRMGDTTWDGTWVGECGGGSRHGHLRGGEYPPMVAVDGSPHLSHGASITDYGRFRRQQWGTDKTVEVGIAAVRG